MSDEPGAALPRVIDFHTHVFRDDVEKRAIDSMSDDVRYHAYYDGTVDELLSAMDRAGVPSSAPTVRTRWSLGATVRGGMRLPRSVPSEASG